MANSHFGEGNKRRLQVEGSRLRIVPETRDLPDKRLLFTGTVKEGGAIFGLESKRVSNSPDVPDLQI